MPRLSTHSAVCGYLFSLIEVYPTLFMFCTKRNVITSYSFGQTEYWYKTGKLVHYMGAWAIIFLEDT